MLAQVRKEYEMLRIEFEQQLAANEQTGPINREMRHLITSLQNHNQQLKGEVHRYRRSVPLDLLFRMASTWRYCLTWNFSPIMVSFEKEI